ncbi:M48 family metalloprotease [Francisella adeliensis]|uniref:M48 family metalloprotease n=1 Tax=Francisella adeliensis TaxID=2007306 RepID=UPI001908B525|nr:M48 family metalloprotease [Francisella adeliensis]MBK2085926.1 M48 family metalloprotease [Francisella adeliensis]
MMWFLMLFNGLLGGILFYIITGIGQSQNYTLWGCVGFVSFVVISFLIAKFMVSKGGNKVLGFIAPARKMSNREKERVKHILHNIQEATKQKKNFSVEDIQLYTMESPLLNAFAMGRNILGVTVGALENLEDEELTGLIAHEFGHFFYKDSERQAINFGLLYFAEALLWINGLLLALSGMFQGDSKDNSSGFIALLILPIVLLALMFKYVGSIGIWVYNITYTKFNRSQEYRADLFACELGFGGGLLSVLEKIKSYEFKDNSFSARIRQTHPDTALRIDEIDSYLAK